MKAKPSKPKAVATPCATFVMSRLSDGAIQYSFFGTDADILGLLEYAKVMVMDRARVNLANTQMKLQQAATPDACK